MKFWIGGAAKTSNVSVIFAQLYIGNQCYGPHAFVVPLRDRDTHMPLKGITIGDCGKKAGMQAVDNGFILFNNFRIPRVNLLNRFSDVTEDGKFKSHIESADQRFALQLGALATGRIMILISCTTAIEMAVKVAIRFAAMRQQFGKPNEPEISLIEYPLHQQRLFPIMAKTFTYRAICQKVI